MVSRYVSNFTLTGINPTNQNVHQTHHTQIPLGVSMTTAPPGSIKGPQPDYHVQQCLVQNQLNQQQQHQTHPHYRIVHSRADAYHVTTPPIGFQSGQQQQQIRPAPATPPTQDIKLTAQPSISLHSFVQRGQQNIFRNSTPNQQNQRVRQPTLIQQQFISALPQNFVMQNYQIPHNYNTTGRQTQSQIFTQNSPVPYQTAPIQSAYQPYPYYYPNPQLMQPQRTGTTQIPIVQQPVTAATQNVLLPTITALQQLTGQIQTVEPRKRRQHAICIVDPMSGKDVLDEILSGEPQQPIVPTIIEIEQNELLLVQQQQQQQLQLQVQQQQQIIQQQQQLEQQQLVVVPVAVTPIELNLIEELEPVEIQAVVATPVVSAISDGPDITPKPSVKIKKW